MLSFWRGLLHACATAILLLGGALTGTVGGKAPGPTLYVGDSVMWEASGAIAHLDRQAQVLAYGGTALCDWMSKLTEHAQRRDVRRVVIEFIGDDFTACIKSRATSVGTRAAAYHQDAAAVVDMMHRAGISVTVLRAPQPAARNGRIDPAAFDAVQDALAAAGADLVVDTGRLISPGHRFTAVLPCRPREPCGVGAPSGFDAARASDGLHLCPGSSATGRCSVYSTSEARFAELATGIPYQPS